MTRANRWLTIVVLAEVATGAILVGWRVPRPRPVVADLSIVDPVAADELRDASASCRTSEDWRRLGELYMGFGYFSEAEICHRIACQRDRNNALFAYQWAFALERLALLDEANAEYRRAMELGHPADDCRYLIARNLLRQEKAAEARATFEEGKALPACRYELARLMVRSREYSPAAALLDELATLYPNALQVYLLRYRLEMERGDARAAFSYADRMMYAVEKLPTPFDAEFKRLMDIFQTKGANGRLKEAQALLDRGEIDAAAKLLRELLAREWTTAPADLLADAAFERGNYKESIRLREERFARDGPTAHAFARLADAWDAAGSPENARANWLKAVQIEAGQDLKNTHFKLSQSFDKAGDKENSNRHLARAYHYAGLEMIHSLRYQEAADVFAMAVKLDPKLDQSWFYLGEARRLLRQTEAAKEAYSSCLAINPNHGRAAAALNYLNGGPGWKNTPPKP
jgi:Tfp pilus assembly protein PilF